MKKQRKPKPGRGRRSEGMLPPLRRNEHLDGLGDAARAFASGLAVPPSKRAATASAPRGRVGSGRAAPLGAAAQAFLRTSPNRTGGSSEAPRRKAAGAGAAAAVTWGDDRAILALLLAPVFLLAFALATNHALRPSLRMSDLDTLERTLPARPEPVAVAVPPPVAVPPQVAVAPPPSAVDPSAALDAALARQAALALPRVAPPVEPPLALPPVVLAEPALRLPATAPDVQAPQIALAPPTIALPASPPLIERPEIVLAEPSLRLPFGAPAIDLPEIALTDPVLRLPPTPPAVEAPRVPELTLAAPSLALPATPPAVEPVLAEVVLPQPRLALPAGEPVIAPPEIVLAAPAFALPSGPPSIPAPVAVVPAPSTPAVAMVQPRPQTPIAPPAASLVPPPAVEVCRPETAAASLPPAGLAEGARFGDRLAAAAVAQTRELVVYNDQYRRIPYPMGDVSPFFGVCTDVVIRAYRGLGIDLQEEVQRARIGSGDASIDHRRTETLRRFLATRGRSLPVSTFAEDYQPGDIVTYHRPQNRRSRSHIAIVTDRIGPSGRPMIVHNRGWGPQIEDALFVDQITGHYRYGGDADMPVALLGKSKPIAGQTRPTLASARLRRDTASP